MASKPIEVRGLTKHYWKAGVALEVLRGVDLDLAAGERVAILGESGSGKSTFLHVLGTLDRPTAGTIRFAGDDVFAKSARQLDALRNREIGFIFQFHHLLPDQDALHNVLIPALIGGLGIDEARKRARELLARVRLSAREKHKPGELSGGEQQRVAIARALVQDPTLILADEPTGNLDPETAHEVFELLLQLNADIGSTLVVVTHSHDLAQRFGRKLHLVEGRFQETEIPAGGTAA
jgi:lipoprotein-releasing system ATP-binding protein